MLDPSIRITPPSFKMGASPSIITGTAPITASQQCHLSQTSQNPPSNSSPKQSNPTIQVTSPIAEIHSPKAPSSPEVHSPKAPSPTSMTYAQPQPEMQLEPMKLRGGGPSDQCCPKRACCGIFRKSTIIRCVCGENCPGAWTTFEVKVVVLARFALSYLLLRGGELSFGRLGTGQWMFWWFILQNWVLWNLNSLGLLCSIRLSMGHGCWWIFRNRWSHFLVLRITWLEG